MSGTRTYLTGYVWTTDHHVYQKAHTDQLDQATLFVPPGDPALQAGAGLAPFVLATPHHAPAGPLAMQAAGLHQTGGSFFSLKEVHSDAYSDPTLKELIRDQHTPKEAFKDVIHDPRL